MKKILIIIILIFGVWFVLNSMNNVSVKEIKADYIDIGYANSLYQGIDKLDKATVQTLVDTYNEIEYASQTEEEINFNKAISITFVHNDQISGQLLIDDKGIFQTQDKLETYQINPEENNIYILALRIYDEIKVQYN